MKSNHGKKLAGLALGIVALGLAVAGVARSDDDDHGLAGSWRATVTVTNPPGLPAMESLMTFVPGGGIVESRRLYVTEFPGGPVIETAGHGAWERARHGRRDVTFQFFFQAGPGHPAAGQVLGTDKIRWRASLNRQTGQLEGPWKSKITDALGNVLFEAEGTIAAAPIAVEPL